MSNQPGMMRTDDVRAWHDACDVLVVGYGIAGACAALEARRAGVDALIVERASGAGGVSILSSGIFYLGGGTPVQRHCGQDDDAEQMYRFLAASTGAPDARLVRRFCDGSVEHFEWLEAQGIAFERTCFKGKAVFLNTTECLMSTGSEKAWPFRDIARPAYRGHKVARGGDSAGSLAMEALIARCAEAGVRALYDSQVTALVAGAGGRIEGVRVRRAGSEFFVRGRRGVILATGGFNMNRDMLKQYCPQVTDNAQPLGIPYNDGAGIRLGMAAGAATQAMNGVIATASFYPPAQLIKGILVNSRGERFVAEDAYHGRTADFILEQPDRRAYLILDSATFAYPELLDYSHHRLVDGWETVEEMEKALQMPPGALRRTLDEYNRHAAEGRDPLFYKDREWLKPLNEAPYAAFDVSFDRSTYLFLTLGGLKTAEDGQVLTAQGQCVPGLYAVGACASSIPQNGKGYASGLSLGPGSFFGRVAGRHAALSQ